MRFLIVADAGLILFNHISFSASCLLVHAVAKGPPLGLELFLPWKHWSLDLKKGEKVDTGKPRDSRKEKKQVNREQKVKKRYRSHDLHNKNAKCPASEVKKKAFSCQSASSMPSGGQKVRFSYATKFTMV